MSSVPSSACHNADYLWMSLLALGFRPGDAAASIGKPTSHVSLGVHMFSKPNKDAFYIVAHFLFEKLNPTRANDVFRFCWPPLDRKTDAEFRKMSYGWLQEIYNECGGCFPKIVASLFLSPGGAKFINLIFHFAKYVVMQAIKKHVRADDTWEAEVAGSKAQYLETKTMRCKLVKNRFQQAALRQHNLIQEYQKKAQSLVKSMRDLRAESVEYDNLRKLKNDHDDQERGVCAGKIKKVQSLWACLKEVISHLEHEKEVVDSVVKGSVDQYTLDGTDVSVKVPRLLLEKIEKSVHTLHTGNLYEAGNINFIRIIELLNDALKLLCEEQLRTGPCKVELDVQLIEGQMKLQTKTLQGLKRLREKITKEALPDVKESILEKEKAWDKKWEGLLKQNPLSLLNNENPALDLLPAMSALSFEPATEAGYKMSVFSQYPAAFPDSPKEGTSSNSFLCDLGKNMEKELDHRRSSLAEIINTTGRAKCTSLSEPCTESDVSGARPNEWNEVQVYKSLTSVNDFSCKRKRTQSLGRIQANALYKEYDNLADKFAEAVATSPAGFGRKAFELEDILSTLTSDPFMTRKELPRTPESLLSDIRISWRKAVVEGEAQQARLSGKQISDETEEQLDNLVDSSIACFMSPQGSELEETLSDPVNKLANWTDFPTPVASCETKKLFKTGVIKDLQSEVSSWNSASNGAGSPDHDPVMQHKLSPEVSFLNMKPALQAGRHLPNRKLTDFCELSYGVESVSLHSTLSWNSTHMLGIEGCADSDIVQFGISNETLPEMLGNESLNSSSGLCSEDEGMDCNKVTEKENYCLTANLAEIHKEQRVDFQSFRSRYEKIRQAYSKTFPPEEVEEPDVETSPQSVDVNPEPAQWERVDRVFTLDLDFLETLTPTSKDKRLTLPKLAAFSPLNDFRSVLGDGAEDFDLV
ncbi:HAUS augmin-like complex subunit 6 [Polyodon spathula]|uniref:HAUS augmin-like complex subunit 6 n=1 Tax=Polyodon spathula TaxID=7913 RepID=UPI001B7F3255|nr:HAUS augmin-like complex subunit 6 [Polyodon spathula]